MSEAEHAAIPRSSGVQLHITSLPGGRLGEEAFRFVDWLAAAGQSWWQVLPLGPPDRFRSPYKSDSAFAAWPGLLADPAAPVSDQEIAEFRERSGFWLDDWERFASRGEVEGMGGRESEAVRDQVRFDREWSALRSYGRERGVRIIGDIPIYVAPDGVDHRAHPEIFQAGFVAGTPPDDYSATGQLWGNPLYDWPALQRRRYRWWVERLRRARELYDLTRIDHFRGLVAYWAVPEGDADALGGRWRRGPGRALFDAAARELGDGAPAARGGGGAAARAGGATAARAGGLGLIAEDLGVITPAVERLRDSLGLPGMLIMQLGFDPDEARSPHRFENHQTNRFVYTATHDNDTVRGWFDGLEPGRRDYVRSSLTALGAEEEEVWWAMIHAALKSPARVAMMQAQDILGLGSEARMNTPSVEGGNWSWQMDRGALSSAAAKRLRALTEKCGRIVTDL